LAKCEFRRVRCADRGLPPDGGYTDAKTRGIALHDADPFSIASWDEPWSVVTVIAVRRCANQVAQIHARCAVSRESSPETWEVAYWDNSAGGARNAAMLLTLPSSRFDISVTRITTNVPLRAPEASRSDDVRDAYQRLRSHKTPDPWDSAVVMGARPPSLIRGRTRSGTFAGKKYVGVRQLVRKPGRHGWPGQSQRRAPVR
jgi:hypothetical protein